MVVARRLGPAAIFLLVATAVYAAALYIRSILPTIESPELVAAALVVDLVVLVPGAYYLLIVRRFRLPLVSVAGVFVLSLIAAGRIIPAQFGRVLTPFEILAGVAEIAILSLIGWRAIRGIRQFRDATAGQTDADAIDAMRKAARRIVDSPRVADVLAYEMALLYYAFASWRQRPIEAPGHFTSYKRNNYGSTLLGIGLLLAVELIGVHLIVQHYWGSTGAWILSILSAYAGIWLLGDWQAQRLRPTVLNQDALILRAGMRWEVAIPAASIRTFRRVSAIEDRPRATLNLVAFGDAHYEIVADPPVTALGVYGMTKCVAAIWFTVDDPAAFEGAFGVLLAAVAPDA